MRAIDRPAGLPGGTQAARSPVSRCLAVFVAALLFAVLAGGPWHALWPDERPAEATTSGLGSKVFATGARVKGKILAASAGYTSTLRLDRPKTITIGSNREVGKKFDLGAFKEGVELVFALYVHDTGATYFTGPGDRNPDGLPHAMVTVTGGVVQIGFEDMSGGGDEDYNDHMFQFTGLDALEITQLKLNDVDDRPLQYLSAARHTYYGGNTRIHGTITLRGGKTDRLTSLELQVVQGDEAVATASLVPAARRVLLVPFGDDGKIVVAESRLLFQLPAAQAARVNGDADSDLTLRVTGETKAGAQGERDFGPVPLLVRYTDRNRYGGRDEGNCIGVTPAYPCGGDDWVLPSVKTIAEHFDGITWGDFSNMNGGPFPKHKGHRDGTEVDGHFAGYNERNAATARKMIEYLNDDTYGSHIRIVYVTFPARPGFWNAIKDVVLDDGRRARDVITDAAEHDTHFHWSLRP